MFNCLVLGKENKVATIIPISIVLIFIPDNGTVAGISDDLEIQVMYLVGDQLF